MCETCSKLKIKSLEWPHDIILVSLLSTLNIFHTFFWCFNHYFGQLNDDCKEWLFSEYFAYFLETCEADNLDPVMYCGKGAVNCSGSMYNMTCECDVGYVQSNDGTSCEACKYIWSKNIIKKYHKLSSEKCAFKFQMLSSGGAFKKSCSEKIR